VAKVAQSLALSPLAAVTLSTAAGVLLAPPPMNRRKPFAGSQKTVITRRATAGVMG